MPAERTSLFKFLLPPVVVAALGVLAFSGMNALAQHVEQSGPTVGDIISFPADPHADASGVRLTVERVAGGTCDLAVTSLRRGGGTLVVEERRPAVRGLRVHWVGGPTAADAGDCGRSADLLLERGDMSTLSLAAGGYGVRVAVSPDAGPAVARPRASYRPMQNDG